MSMSKEQAIEAMERGAKVRHKYFGEQEWVSIVDGKYQFKDGCACDSSEFWHWRVGTVWDTDWSIVKESV